VAWKLHDGKVSTTKSGKSIWKQAATVDSTLNASIDGEKNWRHQYVKHVVRLAELGASSNENGLKIADNGLEEVYRQFEYISPQTGERVPLDEAFSKPSSMFKSVEIVGAKAPGVPQIVKKGEALAGDKAADLVQKWANYGSCEPDVASSIKDILALPAKELAGVLSNHVFVLLGATSAMGPVESLLDLGATVVGVSRTG
jgi:hypothetical protein